MADRAELLRLAERVEGLTGPDRGVGREVLLVCGWRQTCVGNFYGPLYQWSSADGRLSYDQDRLPCPTESLDAAMTLVPEGWGWQVSNRAPKPHAGRAYLNNRELHFTGIAARLNPAFRGVEVTAATPALALTAASLRALSQGASDDR